MTASFVFSFIIFIHFYFSFSLIDTSRKLLTRSHAIEHLAFVSDLSVLSPVYQSFSTFLIMFCSLKKLFYILVYTHTHTYEVFKKKYLSFLYATHSNILYPSLCFHAECIKDL